MLAKAPIMIYNSIYLGPALGSFACEMYGFIGGLTGTVSITTLAAISLDRYYVIVYPLEPIRRTTNARAKICVLITWVYGAIFSSLPLFDIGVGHYIPEGLLTTCSFDYLTLDTKVKTFILVYFFAAWVFPFILIIFCYANILKAVIETQKLGRDPTKTGSISSRHCKDHEKHKTEIKLAGVVVIVIFMWFAAWTPYAIVALLGISGQQQLITPMSSMLPAIFCKIASCVDPFVYAVTHPRFKTELRALSNSFRHQRRNTERQWTSNVGEAQISQISAQAFEKSEVNCSENDVEEIMIMVDLPAATVKNSPMKRGIGLSTVTPVTGTHQKADGADINLTDKNAFKPPSWFVKPKFEDRPSSFKRISQKIRSGSLKKDSEAAA